MKRTKEEALETKQQLIESAVEVIYRKGYSKTTINDIVKNIDMTRGAFYWYYDTKIDILNEIAEHYATNYFNDYTKIDINESAYKTIYGLVSNQLNKIFTDNYLKLAYIIRYKVEAITELPNLVEKQKYIDYIGIDLIKREINRGIRQGEFEDSIDAKTMAVSIFSSIVGLENFVMLHNGDDELSVNNIDSLVVNILNPLREKK